MIGNVAEWTEDCFTGSYSNRPLDARPWIWNGGCTERPVRGGSWASRPLHSRATSRDRAIPDYASADLGFRVARDGESAATSLDNAAAID